MTITGDQNCYSLDPADTWYTFHFFSFYILFETKLTNFLHESCFIEEEEGLPLSIVYCNLVYSFKKKLGQNIS